MASPISKPQTPFSPDRLPEPVALDFFRQVCCGLSYLHFNNVVHGDLKPENLLLSAEGVLKISVSDYAT